MLTRAYRRWRKTMWTAAALFALLAIAWTALLGRQVWYISERGQSAILITSGGVQLHRASTPYFFHGRPGWGCERASESPLYPPDFESQPGVWAIFIPLWLFALSLTILSFIAWRRARTLGRIGCCAKCGYSREGLTQAAPCPECGATPLSLRQVPA